MLPPVTNIFVKQTTTNNKLVEDTDEQKKIHSSHRHFCYFFEGVELLSILFSHGEKTLPPPFPVDPLRTALLLLLLHKYLAFLLQEPLLNGIAMQHVSQPHPTVLHKVHLGAQGGAFGALCPPKIVRQLTVQLLKFNMRRDPNQLAHLVEVQPLHADHVSDAPQPQPNLWGVGVNRCLASEF